MPADDVQDPVTAVGSSLGQANAPTEDNGPTSQERSAPRTNHNLAVIIGASIGAFALVAIALIASGTFLWHRRTRHIGGAPLSGGVPEKV